jgi:hypothetical protein
MNADPRPFVTPDPRPYVMKGVYRDSGGEFKKEHTVDTNVYPPKCARCDEFIYDDFVQLGLYRSMPMECGGIAGVSGVQWFHRKCGDMLAPSYNHTRGDSALTPCEICAGGKRFYVIELTVSEIVDLINRSEHYGPPEHLDPERAREVETADSQKIRIEVEL